MRQASQTVVIRGLVLVVSFLYNIMLSRALGADGVGIWTTTLAFAGIAVQFGNLGLPVSTIYYTGLNRERASSIAATLISASLYASILLTVGFLVAPLVAPRIIGEIDYRSYAIMMLAIVPLLLALAGQNLLLAHQRITAYNLIDLFPRILAFVAAAAIFLWMDRSEWVVAIIWVTVWYAVLTGGLNLLYAWRADAFPFALDFSVLREMLGYGWKSYYANLMAFLIGQIDVVFLNAFISETDAGIYGRVVYLGNLVYFIPATLGTILFPKLMQGGASECTGEDERSRFTMLVARMVTLMLLLMWVLFILVGRWLLLIFGPDFVAGYGPMVIMLGGMGMLGIETILAAELARRGLPMFVVVYSTVCFAVKLIANVVLVQRYGMYGAAWSALVTYAAFLALVLGYCVKCYGFSVSRTLFIQRGDISLVVQRLRAAVGKGQQE